MGRLPKDKVTLSVYVSPRTKEKLECLQQLYFIAGKRFSLSEIVEEAVAGIYAAAYFCLKGKFWAGLVKILFLVFESSEETKRGVSEAFTIAQKKPAAAKEILKVKISLKDNAREEANKAIEKLANRLKSK